MRDTRFVSELAAPVERAATRASGGVERRIRSVAPSSLAIIPRRAGGFVAARVASPLRRPGHARRPRDPELRRADRSAAELELAVGCDFADLFEVKAGSRREGRCARPSTRERPPRVRLPTAASFRRSTHVQLSAAGRDRSAMSPRSTSRFLSAASGRCACSSRRCSTTWSCVPGIAVAVRSNTPHPALRLSEWERRRPVMTVEHEPFGRLLARSTEDLAALRIFDPVHPNRAVVAAGAPWFMTLFGRDSLLTSWMAMMVDPDLALGTLQTLAALQGRSVDPRTEEEPGRILHEVRFGETARALARGKQRLLRNGGRDPAVRHAARRAGALGNRARRCRGAAPGRRPCAAMDRGVRRPRRRRLRRVPAGHRPGSREPGLEGLVGLDPIRERRARARPDRALRGAGLHVRRDCAPGRTSLTRPATTRSAGRLDRTRRGSQGGVQP